MPRGEAVLDRITDPARITAVRATGLMDTPATEIFDNLGRLAARLLHMPLAFVTFVDGERCYWKSAIGTGIHALDTVSRANTVQESFCQYVIAADGPIVVSDASTDPLTRRNPSVLSMGVRAWAGFPVRSADGQVLGTFCVVDTVARDFHAEDLEVLATLAAAATREVVLRQSLDRARELAELTRLGTERATRLAAASERLNRSLDAAQLLDALGDIIVPELGSWMAVGLRAGLVAPEFGVPDSADPDLVRVVAVRHADAPSDKLLARRMRLLALLPTDPRGIGRVTATGVAELQPPMTPEISRARSAEVDPALVAAVADDPIFTVPLTSRGRTIGALSVGAPDPIQLSLLTELAQRAATSLENALTFAAAQRAAAELQQTLTPATPASLSGVRAAVRYLPAATGALAGGDFHQVVRRGEDLVLVLGDIEGHGMTSAARMGQLRAAVAALALQGLEPAELLASLSRETEQILDISLATLLIARFTPATGEFVTASAGHPPAVFAEPGRPAYLSSLDPGPPLGVGPSTFPDRSQILPAGTTVLLYSDGLIERRGENLDIGLERLRTAVGVPDHDPEQVADAVLLAMGCADGGQDDVALLVLST